MTQKEREELDQIHAQLRKWQEEDEKAEREWDGTIRYHFRYSFFPQGQPSDLF